MLARRSNRVWRLILFASIFLIAPVFSPADTAQDVVAHLQTTVSWFRQAGAIEQSAPVVSGDALVRDSIQRNAVLVLQLSFTFAKAEAAQLTAAPQAGQPANSTGGGSGRNLEQGAAKVQGRITGIQSQLSELDSSIQKAAGAARQTLIAQRKELEAQLDLAKQIQVTIEEQLKFMGGSGGASGETAAGLRGQIDALESSVPEARATSTQVPAKAQAGSGFRPENAGIVGLAAGILDVEHSTMTLRNLLQQTTQLQQSISQVRAPLVNQVRALVNQSDSLAGSAASQDVKQLDAAGTQVTSLTTEFKQLSSALVPLGEQSIAVDTTRANLVEWNTLLQRTAEQSLRYLIVRVATLAFVIAVILGFSELWRRATFRYVRDARRRRQFLVLRRVAVGCAITLVLILGFVTEFGSLATYAGFVTAGLAVALQNVILSVVAYFFLIGRYGVRIGDRVTISGVTGNVIDIGLVRLFLAELAGADYHSTGRIVVYSNSVLFQPSAFFKQMPGTDYAWHSVVLTLSSESDFKIAQEKLRKAVETVYADYRDVIERQHQAFERSVEMQVESPHPTTRLRFTNDGIEFSSRYPVDLPKAAAIDDHMLRALYDAISDEPKLTLAPDGAPRLLQAA